MGGIAPTAALPAGAFAKGAGLAERALAGAKAGAVTGAITGLGSSQADITQGDVGGAARDVALGAGSGGGRLIWLMRAGKSVCGLGLLENFTCQQMILRIQTRAGNQKNAPAHG